MAPGKRIFSEAGDSYTDGDADTSGMYRPTGRVAANMYKPRPKRTPAPAPGHLYLRCANPTPAPTLPVGHLYMPRTTPAPALSPSDIAE
ncbi:hypothetical protein KIPB_013996, partial [Kipferlia bialata]|eukprot:g13996.t1